MKETAGIAILAGRRAMETPAAEKGKRFPAPNAGATIAVGAVSFDFVFEPRKKLLF